MRPAVEAGKVKVGGLRRKAFSLSPQTGFRRTHGPISDCVAAL
jgi:hypothetical protein